MPNEIVPFSLKDTPALIEHIWPTGKISAEVQKERKANLGQTLTSLGSYWKGRKPLFLVRACVIGSLLPLTDNPEKDLDIFEKIMLIDDASFENRTKKASDWPGIKKLPYNDRMELSFRPEEMDSTAYQGIWPEINKHLGTKSSSISDLVEQLGIMRFGKRPRVADTFSGSGSIPFEAARVGCDVYASDLNPIACMLTWGSFNIIGVGEKRKKEIEKEQSNIASSVDEYITNLEIEHDSEGNRAKAYLYCLETKCPETGWLVPLLPSRLISKQQKTIAVLHPNEEKKSYDIEIISDADDEQLAKASNGTIRSGRLFHEKNTNELGVPISVIRGDHKDSDGKSKNKLRAWGKHDFMPHSDDIFKERLYCIHWMKKSSLGKSRQETFFSSPNTEDFSREEKVQNIVAQNISEWQKKGLVPDMAIERGKNTTQPIWERGWTYWHHLFSPRQILLIAAYFERSTSPESMIFNAKSLDWNAKVCNWMTAWDKTNNVFYNQALNTFYNYACRCYLPHEAGRSFGFKTVEMPETSYEIECQPAENISINNDIYITDPPYADAVNYHEITEFFIAWLRKNPPSPFNQWEWDSRRLLAIQGDGKEFRAGMVSAYKAMTDHMPDNGLQIVMFTHQSGKVWSDMAQIFWGAGLQVIADWYIATEASTELKKGGYVQGTHIIVLRKRSGDFSGYSDEITQEIKHEVAHQIETMTGLNQSLKGRGRMENLFEDADLQMAGYAAALRILTKYTKIDGKDMTTEALRPRDKKERTIVDELVEFSVQIANEHLVPEGMDAKTWERSTGVERFYLKMLDIESVGIQKLDNYQNFAKAFRVSDYSALMADLKPNTARLKNADDFSKRMMNDDDEFGSSLTRSILYALWEMGKETEDDVVLSYLRDIVPSYFEKRNDLQVIANYIAFKREKTVPGEARNARILANLIKNERIG